MHEAFEHLVAVLLVTTAFSYSALAVNRISAFNIAQAGEADVWRGQLVATVLRDWLSAADGSLDPDKVASLSQTYAQSGGPYKSSYALFVSEIGLPDVNFNLRIMMSLQVSMRKIGAQVQVNVTQAQSKAPVQAYVKLYVFNGTGAEVRFGETGLSGIMNFDISILTGAVAVAYARSGASVGYSAMSHTGAALSASKDKGYVSQGKLENNTSTTRYIFSFQNWVPMQGDMVAVDAFALPVIILWKTDGAHYFIEYPHLPESYGAELPATIRREYRVVIPVRIGNSTFLMNLYTWRGAS